MIALITAVGGCGIWADVLGTGYRRRDLRRGLGIWGSGAVCVAGTDCSAGIHGVLIELGFDRADETENRGFSGWVCRLAGNGHGVGSDFS